MPAKNVRRSSGAIPFPRDLGFGSALGVQLDVAAYDQGSTDGGDELAFEVVAGTTTGPGVSLPAVPGCSSAASLSTKRRCYSFASGWTASI